MDIGAPLVGEVVIPAAPPSNAFGETSRAKRPSLVMPSARAAERRRRGGGSTGDRRAVLEEAGYKRPSKAAIIERAPPRGNREKSHEESTTHDRARDRGETSPRALPVPCSCGCGRPIIAGSSLRRFATNARRQRAYRRRRGL